MMIPVMQDGPGNCMQACIASLLELPLEDVPDFCTEYGDEWSDEYISWLRERGLGVLFVANVEDFLEDINMQDAYVIVAGQSPRKVRHAVVYRGAEMVHDPHPDGGGVMPETLDVIFPLDPSKWGGLGR